MLILGRFCEAGNSTEVEGGGGGGSGLWDDPLFYPHPRSVDQESPDVTSLCTHGCIVLLVLCGFLWSDINVFPRFKVTSYFQSFAMNPNLIWLENFS